MDESFMKERAILPLIASMALPAVVSMIVNSLYNIVDSLFVAMISEQAMTAVSLVFPMQNFVNAVCIGFGVGLNAIFPSASVPVRRGRPMWLRHTVSSWLSSMVWS
jgi:Na+-driven multidrug efflux pump